MTFKSDFLQKIWDRFGQFIKFSLVGLSNSIIAIVVFNLYIYFINKPVWIISEVNVGYSLSFILSIINCYYWNIKYVFPSGKNKKKEITKFVIQYLITYFLGFGLINLFCFFGMHESISQILQMTVTSVINYFGSKFLVFKGSEEEKE